MRSPRRALSRCITPPPPPPPVCGPSALGWPGRRQTRRRGRASPLARPAGGVNRPFSRRRFGYPPPRRRGFCRVASRAFGSVARSARGCRGRSCVSALSVSALSPRPCSLRCARLAAILLPRALSFSALLRSLGARFGSGLIGLRFAPCSRPSPSLGAYHSPLRSVLSRLVSLATLAHHAAPWVSYGR